MNLELVIQAPCWCTRTIDVSIICTAASWAIANRFVRWRRAGVWHRIMDALAAAHDAAVQMIDTSVVRVHQHF
jgi:transposase